MVSKSKVAGTHGMPEGAEMVLSSFEVEVGPPVEAQHFRCNVVSMQACWLRRACMHVCMHASVHTIHRLDLPQLAHPMRVQVRRLLQQRNGTARTYDTCHWWRNSLSGFCPSHSWHWRTSNRAADITAAGDVLCNLALSAEFRQFTHHAPTV